MGSLERVRRMAQLSTRMVEAAKANDWTALARLEQEQAEERDRLALLEPDGRQSEALMPGERAEKAILIQQMLANAAEVRRHVDPWQDSVRRLLSAGSVGRSLRKTYSAGP